MNICAAMGDPLVFGSGFRGASWDSWRTILKAAFALPMSDKERGFLRTVADRDPPRHRVRELWVVAGRRAGKDSIASLIAAHAAALLDGQHVLLRPGERALVQCLACDREQSRIVLGYTRAFFDNPMLRKMVTRETADGLELANGVDISITTNNFRSARGRTVLCAIFDEVAFWRSDFSSSPDEETYRAIRPGLSTLPNSLLVGISSPYRKNGLLHTKFKKHFGRDDDDVLVIRAASLQLNPMLDQAIVAAAIEDDPAAAKAEWLAEFRDDISGFLDSELIESAVDRDVTVRPPVPDVVYYSGCDPSGGSRDSFTMAVAHTDREMVILDCLVEIRAPFNPSAATEQMSTVLKSYGLSRTIGDRYSAQWVIEAFAKCGITYEHSERDRSAIYLDCLPLFTSGRARLLNSPSRFPSAMLSPASSRTSRPAHCGLHQHIRHMRHIQHIHPPHNALNARRPLMQIHVKRGFNLQIGSYSDWGDLGQTLLQLGPGVCEVPPQVTKHWYFQANVRSGNITIIEPAPVAA
jgi:hypothetical protein